MERTCEKCGAHFKAKPAEIKKGKGRFCSRDCFNLSRRGIKKDGVRYRMTRARGHPVAPPSGTVAISRIALYDKIGPGPHPCHWCGHLVKWIPGAGVRDRWGLVVDHLDLNPCNDDPSNLAPSCNPCNSHRRSTGNSAIIRSDELFVSKSGSRRRATLRLCETCGTSFAAANTEIANGKGRFCSMSCARRAPHVK